MKLTLVITKGDEYFIGAIKEIPSVITQGETIEEAKLNVLDALELYLTDMQDDDDHSHKVLEQDLIIS